MRSPTADIPDLPEIPETWEWIQFGDMTQHFRSGASIVPTLAPSPFPILRSSSVRQGQIDLTDIRYLTSAQANGCNAFLREGQLLFTRLSGSIEFVANCAMVRDLAGRRCFFPDRLFCAELKDPLCAPYCELCFGSPVLRKGIAFESKSTAGHQRISMGAVTRFWIPLPPIPEQQEIVRRVEALFKLSASSTKQAEVGMARVEKLTQAILGKAFRGELAPQNPDDEPASKLLERIRSERTVNL